MSDQRIPSAFPVNADNSGGPGAYEADPGMDLRDWFAGQALPAVIRQCANDAAFGYPEGIDSIEEMFAVKSYALADAMLVARQKVSS